MCMHGGKIIMHTITYKQPDNRNNLLTPFISICLVAFRRDFGAYKMYMCATYSSHPLPVYIYIEGDTTWK